MAIPRLIRCCTVWSCADGIIAWNKDSAPVHYLSRNYATTVRGGPCSKVQMIKASSLEHVWICKPG